MSVESALLSPQGQALLAELITRGFDYWTGMQQRYQNGTATQEDVDAAAAMLNIDIEQLEAARAAQRAADHDNRAQGSNVGGATGLPAAPSAGADPATANLDTSKGDESKGPQGSAADNVQTGTGNSDSEKSTGVDPKFGGAAKGSAKG